MGLLAAPLRLIKRLYSKRAETRFGNVASRSSVRVWRTKKTHKEASRLHIHTGENTGSNGADKGGVAQETAAHRAPTGRRERTAGSGRTRPPAPGRRSGRRQKGRLESVALSARTRTTPFCRKVDPRHQITWQISWCEPARERAASEEAFRRWSCDKIKRLWEIILMKTVSCSAAPSYEGRIDRFNCPFMVYELSYNKETAKLHM